MLAPYGDNVTESMYVMPRHALLGTVLFGPFALALLCYVWAFCSNRDKLHSFRNFLALSLKRRTSELRGAQYLYYAAFCLILFDGLTVVCGLAWGILFFSDGVELARVILMYIWLVFRFLSVCQHLITALVSCIFACRPKWGEGLYTASKVIILVPFILIMMSFRIHDGILIGVDICDVLLMLAIAVSFCVLSSSSPGAGQRKPIALLAAVLFFLVVLPNAVANCLMVSSDDSILWPFDVLFFTNFYIVLDPLLFYHVLKLKEHPQSEPQYECAIQTD